MVKRKRSESKTLRLSSAEKAEADRVKRELDLGDTDLYNRGVSASKVEADLRRIYEGYQAQDRREIRNKLIADSRLSPDVAKRMGVDFKGDPLISERYGNLGFPISHSEAAMMYHNISLVIWEALSEAEKADYIARTPDPWKELQRGPGHRDE